MHKFLDGAKSEILKYDVISFDIFDTLLLRPFIKPIDLFLYIETKYDIKGFCQARILAEMQSREISKEQDITLDEIYHQIPKEFHSYKEVEIATEKEVLIPNLEMLELYRFAKENNKRVIIVSDMYLPLEVLEDILISKGFDGYTNFYLSSHIMLTKHSKDLFKHVLKQENITHTQILHIGDNSWADDAMPKSLGIATLFRKSVLRQFEEIFPKYKTFSPTSVAQSFVLGSLCVFYKNYIQKHEKFDYWFLLGAMQAGIVAVAYCQFIYKEIHKRNIDTLVFVARDGYLLQKIFNILYPNSYKTTYVYAPRILKKAVFLEVIEGESLEILRILEGEEEIQKKQITTNQQAYIYIYSNFEHCRHLALKCLDNYRKYLSSSNLEGNIAIVDTITLGYSSQELIQKALNKEVFGCYVDLLRILNHDCVSFLPFSHPKSIYFHNWDFMEFLLTSPEYPILNVENGVPIYQKDVSSCEKHRSKAYEKIVEGAVGYASYFKESQISLDIHDVIKWVNFFIDHPSIQDQEQFKQIYFLPDATHKNALPLFCNDVSLLSCILKPSQSYGILKRSLRTNKQERLFKILSLIKKIYGKLKKKS
ncbi:HAD-IA family hydrolase [Helicobacter pylori]|uniref:HAD-IA family hydrolase n=1 Tax=Helicobacter pylori TaxID=210 RepID=UPI0012B1D799|nr:HAD-IA family hydrolase [Helicobacter pylori]